MSASPNVQLVSGRRHADKVLDAAKVADGGAKLQDRLRRDADPIEDRLVHWCCPRAPRAA
eukprot:15501625-Heterocapsa_arctica.AAC.1